MFEREKAYKRVLTQVVDSCLQVPANIWRGQRAVIEAQNGWGWKAPLEVISALIHLGHSLPCAFLLLLHPSCLLLSGFSDGDQRELGLLPSSSAYETHLVSLIFDLPWQLFIRKHVSVIASTLTSLPSTWPIVSPSFSFNSMLQRKRLF